MKAYITIYFNGGFNKQFTISSHAMLSEFNIWANGNFSTPFSMEIDEGSMTTILKQNICYIDIETLSD